VNLSLWNNLSANERARWMLSEDAPTTGAYPSHLFARDDDREDEQRRASVQALEKRLPGVMHEPVRPSPLQAVWFVSPSNPRSIAI